MRVFGLFGCVDSGLGSGVRVGFFSSCYCALCTVPHCTLRAFVFCVFSVNPVTAPGLERSSRTLKRSTGDGEGGSLS